MWSKTNYATTDTNIIVIMLIFEIIARCSKLQVDRSQLFLCQLFRCLHLEWSYFWMNISAVFFFLLVSHVYYLLGLRSHVSSKRTFWGLLGMVSVSCVAFSRQVEVFYIISSSKVTFSPTAPSTMAWTVSFICLRKENRKTVGLQTVLHTDSRTYCRRQDYYYSMHELPHAKHRTVFHVRQLKMTLAPSNINQL